MPSEHSRFATEAIVYAGGVRLSSSSVLDITDGCGASALPRARIQLQITDPTARTNLRIDNQEIEITFRSTEPVPGDPTASQPERVMFWGALSGDMVTIGRGEAQVLEARAGRHHFGKPLDGVIEFNPLTNSYSTLPVDLEFNPTVNFSGAMGQRVQNTRGLGVVRGNMSAKKQWGRGKANSFLDPARVFTAAARLINDGGKEAAQESFRDAKFLATDKAWTLTEACYYLCWSLNEDEKHYKNPRREDLAVLNGSTAILRDVVIPMGTFLPDALDKLLTPFGYGWRIEYLGRGSRRIAVFSRAEGTARAVKLQKPGAVLDPSKSNVETCQIGVGIESLVNEVRVYGNRELVEATFELKRAWSSDLDATDLFLLNSGHPDWKDNPERHRVWRDWVLGEGGDIIGIREDYTKPYDLSTLFGVPTVPRRRRFLPCLALDKDRLPVGQHGYYVEFWDGERWLSIDRMENATYEVLTNECGVRFTGITPPEQLVFYGASAKIRITASVYADSRLSYIAKRNPASSQKDTIPVVIDAETSFHKRRIDKSSQFYEVVRTREYESSQCDDTQKLREYANQLRDAWDQSDVSATITISNIDDVYSLGTVIQRIDGREIDFDIGSTQGNRYPQVVARSFDVQSQKQTLTLETMRNVRTA